MRAAPVQQFATTFKTARSNSMHSLSQSILFSMELGRMSWLMALGGIPLLSLWDGSGALSIVLFLLPGIGCLVSAAANFVIQRFRSAPLVPDSGGHCSLIDNLDDSQNFGYKLAKSLTWTPLFYAVLSLLPGETTQPLAIGTTLVTTLAVLVTWLGAWLNARPAASGRIRGATSFCTKQPELPRQAAECE